MSEYLNVGDYLTQRAKEHPYRKAVIFPEKKKKDGSFLYSHLTFKMLNEQCDAYAHGLTEYGIKQGMKVLLFVKPGLEFLGLTYALFKVGAVPVLIDPGMGKTSFLNCIRSVNPDALIGIPKAHAARFLFPGTFKKIRYNVFVGKKVPLQSGKRLEELALKERGPFQSVKTRPRDMATIVFTTGSTGAPKGVCYFHEQMRGQVEAIQKEFQINEQDVDFPIFPLFALFSVAWGIPAVIPVLDATKPSAADPEDIAKGIEDHGVTISIGSPALWAKVARYMAERDRLMPSMRAVMMVGAPIRPEVLEDFSKILPAGDAYTPYGATEALPIANISGSYILKEAAAKTESGAGTCVGRPFPGITFGIIPITEEAVEDISRTVFNKPGEIGEIVVSGPIVTREYYEKPEPTRLAKIKDGDRIWHRMGDVGYLDENGYLWFCGRKAHRVESNGKKYFSVPCEAIYNRHPKLRRSALVGVKDKDGSTQPLMIFEVNKGVFLDTASEKNLLLKELKFLGSKSPLTKDIDLFLFHPEFPVDIRHNAKIFREKLAVWAQEQLGGKE
jgi:acyl-CoA synthetase (AMP-forming)/AMP-acid ligase II